MSAADDAAARVWDMMRGSDGPFSSDVRLVLADRDALTVPTAEQTARARWASWRSLRTCSTTDWT